MSMITSNLKLYIPFQKQPLGFKFPIFLNLFFVIALFVSPLLSHAKSTEIPFFLLLWIGLFLSLFGQMVTMVQIDIITKPFSYCLPSHKKVPRQMIFMSGIVMTTIYTIALLFLPLTIESKHFMLIIFPVVVWTFYLLPVCITLYLQNDKYNKLIVCSIIILVLLFWVSFVSRSDFSISIKDIGSYCLIPLLFSTILLSTAVWKMMGDSDFKRKSIGKDSTFMVALYTKPLDREEWTELFSSRRLYKNKKEEKNSADLFLQKMKKQPYFSLHRSLLGTLYNMMSKNISSYNRSPIAFLSITVIIFSVAMFLSGYHDSGNIHEVVNGISMNMVQMIVLLSVCCMIEGMFNAPRHNHLLPISRSGQFWIHFTLWLIKPVMIIVWLCIVIAASWSLEHSMPDLKLMSYHFTYHQLGIDLIILSLIILPILSGLFSFSKTLWAITMWMSISAIVGVVVYFLSVIQLINLRPLMIWLVFITNGLFVGLLVYYWFRRDHA